MRACWYWRHGPAPQVRHLHRAVALTACSNCLHNPSSGHCGPTVHSSRRLRRGLTQALGGPDHRTFSAYARFGSEQRGFGQSIVFFIAWYSTSGVMRPQPPQRRPMILVFVSMFVSFGGVPPNSSSKPTPFRRGLTQALSVAAHSAYALILRSISSTESRRKSILLSGSLYSPSSR